MGLLKAGIGAAGGVLADSWRDYFYCESMPVDVLVQKGQKRVSGRSSNKRGEDNIISNGSIIAVADGQCMIIVQQGEIVDVCAEPGEFVFDSSTEPSIFYGGLGKGIMDTFARIGHRFTFGGDTGNDQRVYFFNTKEIIGNRYGTATPVPFLMQDPKIGLYIELSVRCNGEYSYRIVDPLLFYKNVCGNVADKYLRSEIDSQMKSEFLTALQPAFAAISETGVRYSQIPAHTKELANALRDELTVEWTQERGIALVKVGVNSVSISPEDEDRLKNLQTAAMMSNPGMAAGNLVAAQSDAMRDAAKNPNGAAMGFMGMNMAAGSGGMNANQLFQMQAQQQVAQQQAAQQAPAAPAGDSWTCECGSVNTGKFCPQCGSPKPVPPAAPESAAWFCPECGAQNEGKFCSNCGTPRP